LNYENQEKEDLEKDVYDIILDSSEKRKLITIVRERAIRASKFFLLVCISAPLVNLLLLAFINTIDNIDVESQILITVVLGVTAILQFFLSLYMHKRFKKISKTDDSKITETALYKAVQNEKIDKDYQYDNHTISIKTISDKYILLIDNQEKDVYKGSITRNFKLSGKIGKDKVIVVFKNGFSGRNIKVYYNNILL